MFWVTCWLLVAFTNGLEDHMMKKAECQMWSKLENKTLPLQDQGHANCTTNSQCTGFDCKGIYQDQGLDFGLEVLPCTDPPGVKIFGSAPQFHAKNFSHIFVHGQDYEIPGAILNSSMLPSSAVLPSSETESIKGRLEVQIHMNKTTHIMKMGLVIKACINATCLFSRKVFDGTEVPVPPCTNHITTEEHKSTEDLTEYCNINELFSCGEHQVCIQLSSDDTAGQCQCKQGYDKQDDGTCLSLEKEDELIAQHKEEERTAHAQPLPIAKESGFVETKTVPENRPVQPAIPRRPPVAQPSPHIKEGSSSGAIAAGIVSVLIVILIGGGFTYMVTRTRLIPRLRARITNTPYEDIVLNPDRRNPANAATAQTHHRHTPLA